MRTPARASAFADSLRLGDTVIGLFCGRWMLMALNPSMGSDPMEVALIKRYNPFSNSNSNSNSKSLSLAHRRCEKCYNMYLTNMSGEMFMRRAVLMPQVRCSAAYPMGREFGGVFMGPMDSDIYVF